MNKRDLEATFRVIEKQGELEIRNEYMTGQVIQEYARDLVKQTSGAMRSFWLHDNASLRTCMRTIAKWRNLTVIETRRYYSHCIGYSPRTGTPRRHDRLADPIFEYGEVIG